MGHPPLVKKCRGIHPPIPLDFRPWQCPYIYTASYVARGHFHSELWRRAVCERTAHRGPGGPWQGLQGGSAPLPKKILYLMGMRYVSSLVFLVKKAQKNSFWKGKSKKLMTPLLAHQKSYDPPFSSSKKSWPTPIFYRPPSGRNNERSLSLPKFWCYFWVP